MLGMKILVVCLESQDIMMSGQFYFVRERYLRLTYNSYTLNYVEGK